MTCLSLPTGPSESSPELPSAFLDLVRFLAREAARTDFVTRRDGEVTND